MDAQPIRKKDNPEAKIQQAIKNYLAIRGWWTKATHGNAYNDGWPDLFACHHSYGQRWIEVKLPDMKGSKFTAAQLRDFPQFMANGSGVWVLTGGIASEYNKLFQPPNWWMYTSAMK